MHRTTLVLRVSESLLALQMSGHTRTVWLTMQLFLERPRAAVVQSTSSATFDAGVNIGKSNIKAAVHKGGVSPTSVTRSGQNGSSFSAPSFKTYTTRGSLVAHIFESQIGSSLRARLVLVPRLAPPPDGPPAQFNALVGPMRPQARDDHGLARIGIEMRHHVWLKMATQPPI